MKLNKKDINPNLVNMLYTDDFKCNYICGSTGENKDLERLQKNTEIVDFNKVDYEINTDINNMEPEPEPENNSNLISNTLPEKTVEDKTKTLSFMSVKSVEEGIDWYKQNYPKVPEELLPVMARWNWGDLSTMTKKQAKNEKKKAKKKENKKPHFSIVKKPTIVSFD
tara:strand:+ start:4081 stop:4581 length:501 start_codon:yes stop_codon:yes gene_type:complete